MKIEIKIEKLSDGSKAYNVVASRGPGEATLIIYASDHKAATEIATALAWGAKDWAMYQEPRRQTNEP